MRKFIILVAAIAFGASSASSQCAGCDADFNKAERERLAKEKQAEADSAAARDRELRELLPKTGGAADAADAKIKHREELEKTLNQPE